MVDHKRKRSSFVAALLLTALLFTPAYSQGTVEVHGLVADPTGAVIGGATVTLADDAGHKYTAKSDDAGVYRITGIVKGSYTITVEDEGFSTYTQKLDLTARTSLVANATLEVSLKDITENINADNSQGISTESDANLSGISLSPEEIKSLPDDPDDMLAQLRQMAGPSEDAQIYVDGYREGGRLPPKEAILTIRINNNPFSAQFVEPGFGRIEIVTKPGTSDYHGGLRFNFDDQYLNGRNAFALERTPLTRSTYNVFLTGPIIKNRWDFFFNFERRDLATDTVVNALDPNTFAPFITSVGAPQTLTNYEIRTNYLINNKNTFGVWYRHTSNVQDDQGIGGFSLPSQAFTSTATDNTLRFSVTTVATESAVNEIRTEISRRTNLAQAINDATQVTVQSAFTTGGNQNSLLNNSDSNNLAFSDDLTYTHKTHTFKFGFRTDASEIENTNRSNFGGSFLFSGNRALSLTPLQQYMDVIHGVPGITPSQFSIILGNDFVGLTQWDYGWYANDDWKISQSLNMSLGIREEMQTHLGDKTNFAPRFSLAWAPDKAHKSTIRFGSGIFYTIVTSGVTQAATLGNGVEQQQVLITNPPFFTDIPSNLSGLGGQSLVERTIKDSDLRMPYLWMNTISYERSLPLKLQGSISYSYQRGVHLLREQDLNQKNPTTGLFPFPGQGPILDVESTGSSVRHEMRLTVNRRLGKVNLFANYLLSSTHADTDGWGTLPANSYDLAAEWGRVPYDAHHRVFVGGNVSLPHGFSVAPFIFAQSGGAFNILGGVPLLNVPGLVERPAFAGIGTPGAVLTPYGLLNPNPAPGEQLIPRNFGRTPGSFNTNLNVGKTFGLGRPLDNTNAAGGGRRNGQGGGFGGRGGGGGFGPGGGPGGGFSDSGHRYSLTVYAFGQNLFNHVNLGSINPVLTSPIFNLPETAGGARVITLGIRFNF